MKTYEEKAHSVLSRIEEEKETIAARKMKTKRTAMPIMSVCLAAALCVGVWNTGVLKPAENAIMGGGTEEAQQTEAVSAPENTETAAETDRNDGDAESVKPTDAPMVEPHGEAEAVAPAPNEESVTSIGDALGWLAKDGVFYLQWCQGIPSDYTNGTYLGRATTFEGYYRDMNDDGELYVSAENPNVLILHLDNGGVILLSSKM